MGVVSKLSLKKSEVAQLSILDYLPYLRSGIGKASCEEPSEVSKLLEIPCKEVVHVALVIEERHKLFALRIDMVGVRENQCFWINHLGSPI